MDDRTQRRLWEKGVGKIQQRTRATRYKCMVPECTQTAIASHSQQRERQLRSIARDGRVYALDRNLYAAAKRGGNADHDSPATLRLQGIGAVSTFAGFCGRHDADLFRRLDQESVAELDREQAWALFLRTFAYEFAQKRKSFEVHGHFQKLFDELHDRDSKKLSQIAQAGVGKMLKTDAPEYFRRLWQARERDGFPGIVHHQRLIAGNLGLSTSCMFSPLSAEARLRGFMGPFQPLVAFNIVPNDAGTLIVASVLDEHAELARWIAADLADDSMLEALVHRCAFAESEDTCVRPQLWESLDESTHNEVRRAMEHEMYRGPMHGMPRIVQVRP